MKVKGLEWEGTGWIQMAQDRGESRAVVKIVMTLRGFVKCWELLR